MKPPRTQRAATVLVVDDEPAIRSGLRALLESLDFAVLEAADLVEARRREREDQPDIVVLDLRLGDGNGWELLDEIRRREPSATRTTVLVFSAFADFRIGLEALRRGADACVGKSDDGALRLLEAIWRESRSRTAWRELGAAEAHC